MIKLNVVNKDWDMLDLAKHILELNGFVNTNPQYFDKEKGVVVFGDTDNAVRAKETLKKYHIETEIQGEYEPV